MLIEKYVYHDIMVYETCLEFFSVFYKARVILKKKLMESYGCTVECLVKIFN